MYQLLILDDEPIIVNGLMQLFSEINEELDIYPAYSVREALKIAIQIKIDIVITDMRMPEKSGIQFIDELQTLWPQCRIIFLSGYDNFDYVYNAMKRNIDSYVLKTEDDEVLINAVRKSIRRIQEERMFHNLIELSDSQLKNQIEYPIQHFWKKELPILENAISEGNYSKCMEIMNELFNELYDSNQTTNIVKTEFLYSISLLLIGYFRKHSFYQYMLSNFESFVHRIMDSSPGMITSKEDILFLLRRICDYQLISRKEKNHNLIFSVNEYIKENISGDLSLTSIAKSVYLNPSYLSRFYKEQTGINISDFINQLKLDKAKYYLGETEMYIQTIASKLGFNSPSYFTLFFKKNVHISPQDYREQSRKK